MTDSNPTGTTAQNDAAQGAAAQSPAAQARATSPPSVEVQSFIRMWADSISAFAKQMGGADLACEVLSVESIAAATPEDLWLGGAWTGALRGEMACRIPPASAVALAKLLMSEPPAAAPLSDEYKEGAIESLRQVAGLVVTSVRSARGEAQLRLEAASGAPSWPPGSQHWLRSGAGTAGEILIELQLSAAMLAAFRANEMQGSPSGPAEPPSSSAPNSPDSRLDVLMDVEMETTLRFGERRLLLREVLDLVPGSLIELDRRVEDPVDLILDGKIIARGEVVVMDGNYGLRVTEVLGRQSRQAAS